MYRSLSKSQKNKLCIKKAGGLPLIARLVRMRHTSILVPIIGTLQVGAFTALSPPTQWADVVLNSPDKIGIIQVGSPIRDFLCPLPLHSGQIMC